MYTPSLLFSRGLLWADQIQKVRLVHDGRLRLRQRVRPVLAGFDSYSLVVRPRRRRRKLKKEKKSPRKR